MATNTYTPLLSYLTNNGQAPSMANLKELAVKQGFVDYSGTDADNIQLSNILKTAPPQTTPAPAVATTQPTPAPQASADDGYLKDANGKNVVDTYGNKVKDERGNSTLSYAPIDANAGGTAKQGEIAESMDVGGYKAIPTLSAEESTGLANKYGLAGTKYESAFSGLTTDEAQKKAQDIQNQLRGTVSQNTSYSFNPSTIAGVKTAVDGLRLKLKDTLADTWNSPGTQQDKAAGLFEATANSLAKLFTSSDDLYSQYNNNPQLKAALDDFVAQGGKINTITDRIQAPAQNNVDSSRRDTVLSLVQQGVKDPNQILDYVNYDQNGNRTGDFTLAEVQGYLQGGNNQDTATYLSSLGVNPTPEAVKAYESLIPEQQTSQAEIARLASIPQNQMDLYFGTPDQIGIYQEKKANAEAQTALITKKQADDETSLRTQADLAMQKVIADHDSKTAEIEENRLNAKNYITGALAKLGALNTTGAAPVAIAKLDQKYQLQQDGLDSTFDYDQKKLNSDLTDKINDIENTTQDKILSIQSDLSKDKSTIIKEIFDLQKDSDAKISTISSGYATKLREQTDKYATQAKSASDKYTRDYLSLVSKGYNPATINKILKGDVQGVTAPPKKASTASTATYSPAETKDLRQGGLTSNSTEVKDFFLNTEPAFRDAWSRNYANGQNKNPTIANITKSYNDWKAATAPVKKTASTTQRVLPQ